MKGRGMNKVCIIAEAGVNHNGDLDLAKKMIDIASEAGVDMVKFQTFRAENVASKVASKAAYQIQTTGGEESQLDMLKKLEFSQAQFEELWAYCTQRGIQFLSTPFDLESVDFLEGLGLPCWKIPSGEITNLPYLLRIARSGKPVILSSGMSTMDELHAAVDVLTKNGASEVIVLHCNTEYPTPFEDANIRAILTIKKELGIRVGYSDHTVGIDCAIAAAALGATVIEKHFTLNKNMDGPDHKASLEPQELRAMTASIRNIEKAMGCGEKVPSPSEIKNIAIARKSIVAKRAIQEGEALTEDNITVKRPGNGVSPMRWFEVLGMRAVRNFGADELIEL